MIGALGSTNFRIARDIYSVGRLGGAYPSRESRMGKLGTLGGQAFRRTALTLQEVSWLNKVGYLEMYLAAWRYRSLTYNGFGRLLASASTRQLDSAETEADRRIDSIRARTEEANVECRVRSIAPPWGLFIMKLMRQFKPHQCLELGTAFGVSSLYEIAGLRLNGGGTLYTLDGSPSHMAIARKNLDDFGAEGVKTVLGMFEDTLEATLEEIGSVDFAFLDGDHEKGATIEHFEKVTDYATTGAVILVDDILWSKGMREAWRSISKSPKVANSFDLIRMGLCFLN